MRDEGRIVLATLVRKLGSLDLAEDAVQEAVLRALETWPTRGLPRLAASVAHDDGAQLGDRPHPP